MSDKIKQDISIGANLKRLRKNAKLSQEQVSAKLFAGGIQPPLCRRGRQLHAQFFHFFVDIHLTHPFLLSRRRTLPARVLHISPSRSASCPLT